MCYFLFIRDMLKKIPRKDYKTVSALLKPTIRSKKIEISN